MAITPKDITTLKESFKDTFATKEDLKAFATKKTFGQFGMTFPRE